MRLSAGLVIATGIIALVVLQKQREPASPQQPPAAAVPTVATAAAPPSANASQQHWPKRALDRAADVKRQVADQRKSDETR